MANKSNRYRAGAGRAAEKPARKGLSGQPAATSRWPIGRFWLGRPAIGSRVRRPRRRREGVILAVLALAIVVGLGALGTGLYMAKANQDWASVAKVNGTSISREALRGRMAVLKLLTTERETFIRQQVTAGKLTSDEAAAFDQAAAAETTVEAVQQGSNRPPCAGGVLVALSARTSPTSAAMTPSQSEPPWESWRLSIKPRAVHIGGQLIGRSGRLGLHARWRPRAARCLSRSARMNRRLARSGPRSGCA